MDKYKVMLYPKALKDIDGIYNYIAQIKLSPENAQRQTDRIWNVLQTLDTIPSIPHNRKIFCKKLPSIAY